MSKFQYKINQIAFTHIKNGSSSIRSEQNNFFQLYLCLDKNLKIITKWVLNVNTTIFNRVIPVNSVYSIIYDQKLIISFFFNRKKIDVFLSKFHFKINQIAFTFIKNGSLSIRSEQNIFFQLYLCLDKNFKIITKSVSNVNTTIFNREISVNSVYSTINDQKLIISFFLIKKKLMFFCQNFSIKSIKLHLLI